MPSTVQQVGFTILGISLVTFVALFGHVPGLRNTPIGRAHRFLWKTLPRWCSFIDRKLTGGHLGPALRGIGYYLLYEKHPIIMAFYLTLVSGGLYMFIKDGWEYLALVHRICVPIVAALPYITIYVAAYSDPGFVTPGNHHRAMMVYPFDRINFHPGNICRTCQFAKPARSKHCSVCKHCVSKHDHHCAWINNCVGHLNTRHFLAFLIATNVLLSYGFYLSFSIMHFLIRQAVPAHIPLSNVPWKVYFHLWSICIAAEVYMGAVMLLAALTGVLSYGFTGYHLYLIWAGTTTSETFKWSDWRDDIANGEIMIADPDEGPAAGDDDDDEEEMCKDWPRKSNQFLCRVDPANRGELPRGIVWWRVKSLDEIVNIYDLGWRRNLEGVLWPREL